jgi:4-amino-4-deoxy-L-arabinose transferase-like glycosyltransferase
MLPVADIHRLTTGLPPYVVSARILIFGVVVLVLCAVWRRRDALRRLWPAVVYILAGASAFWPLSRDGMPAWARLAAVGLAGAALIVEVLRRRGEADPPPDPEGDGSARVSRRYLIAALLLAAVLLFDNLGTYAGTMMVAWEATVVEGFADAFLGGQSVATFLAQRFLWDDGLVSGGQTSLFYGAPTYALFHLAGFTPWTLRCCAALATLLALIAIYALGRRFFSSMIGATLAVLLLVNPVVIFYGRYGTSLAGTLLAVVLALYAAWSFVDAQRSAWWKAILCAVGLYVATLQYSPARLVVLILLLFIAWTAVVQWRTLSWSRAVGLALILIATLGVWHFEGASGRRGAFLNARGEQYFALLENPGTIESLLGHRLRNNPRRAADVVLQDKIELLERTLQTTIPEYVRCLTPNLTSPTGGIMFQIDPPPLPLYDPPAVLFIAWGFLLSVAQWRSWKHQCLLLWVTIATVPLLLTNRVDVHRIMLFVVPLSLWGAIGVREAARCMRQGGVPAFVQHALAAGLIVAAVLNTIILLYPPQAPESKATVTLRDEVRGVAGAVQVGCDWDHRSVATVQLDMLERKRRDPHWEGQMLTAAMINNVTNSEGRAPTEAYLRDLKRIAERSVVLLAPAENFRKTAAAMQGRGLRVSERGSEALRIVRIDGGAAVTGVRDADLKPLPTLVIVPTPTPLPLRGGPQVPLTNLAPTNVEFGFEAPKMRHNGSGPPVSLGGVQYPSGMRTHAWMKMTYEVPAGATHLQAIVGVDDDIRECSKASVTFQVRGANDALLYDSGLVDPTTPPRSIRVDLHGAKQITLVVTDAGDGIECDHADWALPAFLLPEKK